MVTISERRYTFALAAAYVFGAAANAWSTILAFFDPAFRGLLPYGGSEEAMYLLRTQEAFLHPFTNVTNGVWSGQYAPLGLQSAGVEQLLGALFWWTALPAPWVVFWMHVLIAPLAIPLMAALARRVGAGRVAALLMAVVMFWFFVYCRRLFHPGFSFPLVLATLILLWRWYERPTFGRAVALGVPLGFGVGVYLWSWTFLWPATAFLAIAALADSAMPKRGAMLRTLPWLALATIASAAPALHHLAMARLLPFFQEASVRAGLVHTRLPESPARSLITIVLLGAAAWIFRKKDDRPVLPLLCMLGALALAYNQQLVHGIVMSFSSHYINYLSLAAALLIVAIAARKKKSIVAIGTCALCAALLALNFNDMSGRTIAFMPPPPDAMRMQHLRPALDELNRGTTPMNVLADKNAADIVATYTPHDVVFTEYSGFLLVPDKEYAERACMAELFAPEPPDYEKLVVHAEERLRVLRKQETQAEYDASLANAKRWCAELRADKKAALARYGVEWILWDERNRPDWKVDWSVGNKSHQGDGWSLWEVLP